MNMQAVEQWIRMSTSNSIHITSANTQVSYCFRCAAYLYCYLERSTGSSSISVGYGSSFSMTDNRLSISFRYNFQCLRNGLANGTECIFLINKSLLFSTWGDSLSANTGVDCSMGVDGMWSNGILGGTYFSRCAFPAGCTTMTWIL